eukprot:Stramenopile-MAST_4_protein_1296
MISPRSKGRPQRQKKATCEKLLVKFLGFMFACVPLTLFAFILSYAPRFLNASLAETATEHSAVTVPHGQHASVSSGDRSFFSRFLGSSDMSAAAAPKAWSSLDTTKEVKPFRIFVYDLPEKFNARILRESWRCGHHMFAAEVAIHKYLLHSAARTKDPNEAALFYIPVYTTCKCTSFAGNGPDPWFGRNLMTEAVLHVSTTYPYWNKNKGRDHVVAATHDYGACFDYLRSNAHRVGIVNDIKNAIILSSLGDTKSPCYNTDQHITIPTFLPVQSVGGARTRADWTKAVGLQLPLEVDDPISFDNARRDQMAFFWGALEWTDARGKRDDTYSHGVRQELQKQYADDPWFTLRHVTRDGDGKLELSQYAQHLKRSVFCLAPAGFAPWSARIYEAVHYGCIPVLIADTIVLPFDDQLDWKAFSIKISEHDLKIPGRLKEILQKLSPSEIRAKQAAMQIARNALMYQCPAAKEPGTQTFARQEKGGVAFDYVLRELEIKAGVRRVSRESAEIRRAARSAKGWW